MTSRQIPLDLPHEPSFAREDFLESAANVEALRAVETWPHWAGGMLLLIGPGGSGKSHLGAIWARSSGAAIARPDALPATPGAPALLIDDADRIGERETALFHLINQAREADVALLLTARAPPDAWLLTTADLVSRLRLAPVARLQPPDDDLARAVLFKLFADRQLAVDPSVIAYIALRIERSLGAARAIVAALDREGLARGKAVTRAMAAEVLKGWTGEE
jgi:chromosomal replication initiation ATPase DnaA